MNLNSFLPFKQNIALLLFAILPVASDFQGSSPEQPAREIKLGAYYFDGWTGKYAQHISPKLMNSFSNRKPKWGWITSSQKVVDQQILAASGAGLSFFSFCWYYSGKDKYKSEPLNNALKFFQQSAYTGKMEYCLMVANHKGFEIGKEDWSAVQAEWVRQFKTANYLKVDGKPLLIFFSVASLVKNFGSADSVKSVFQSLRTAAIANGSGGVTIAACIAGDQRSISEAEDCGFDILTGYNEHSAGFGQRKTTQIPIDSMQTAENRLWNRVVKVSHLKYIPVSTLNWDPRPWAAPNNAYDTAPYFVGYSEKSVYKSVLGMMNWAGRNGDRMTKERIGLLYAWNENGEGAYLTPSENGPNFLRGLQKALNN
ncbi:glycoside hydrolase family 99-like domain-containing protein [Pedobacter sp. PAMC26386]|nr:glycoside hydrolase family 99-like domain-containing protein [Pedobacter sp. PAMC26386]